MKLRGMESGGKDVKYNRISLYLTTSVKNEVRVEPKGTIVLFSGMPFLKFPLLS